MIGIIGKNREQGEGDSGCRVRHITSYSRSGAWRLLGPPEVIARKLDQADNPANLTASRPPRWGLRFSGS
jgi:hypothetical protein